MRHLSHYARHVSMAAARKIVDHSPWMVESTNPYPAGEMDMVKLSQEESLKDNPKTVTANQCRP